MLGLAATSVAASKILLRYKVVVDV
jgi:hypothetical protein